jgi:opacity protein-like surface antigen
MRRLPLLIVFLTLTFLAKSQLRIGIFGGISNYLGDLSDKVYQNSGVAVGINVSYPITNRISIRGGYTYGKVKGADSLNPREDFKLRNLSFQSPISEFSLVAEINTFDMDYKRWSPYVFGGLAVYHFNPYTYDQQNNQIFLQPMSTEGQGLAGYEKPYSLTQLALPFGGGIKYDISENVRISLEIGLRKLFTDYLDDLSGTYADANDLLAAKGPQAVDISYRGDEVAGGNPAYPVKGWERGSPKSKDYYYFSGLHLNFALPGGENQKSYNSKMGKNKRYGCPTVF